MATNTPNLNLKKPAYTDPVDIADLNGNMDKIDQQIGSLSVFLNPKSYGAKGDGVTYDAQAIIDCINDAYTKGIKEVHVPSGTYLLDKTVKIISKHDIKLIGVGYVEFKMKTGFIVSSSNPSAPDNRVIHFDNCNNITVENIVLNGNASDTSIYNGYGIAFLYGTNCRLKDCIVKNLGGEGVVIEGGSKIWVENTEVTNTNHGINYYNGATDVFIDNVRVDVRGYGIFNEASFSSKITNSRIKGTNAGYIGWASDLAIGYAQNIDSIILDGNEIIGGLGIKIYEGANQILDAIVTNNKITSDNASACQLTVSNRGIFEGNTVIGTASGSLAFESFLLQAKNTTISGNIFKATNSNYSFHIRDDNTNCRIGLNNHVGIILNDANKAAISRGNVYGSGDSTQVRGGGNGSLQDESFRRVNANYTVILEDSLILCDAGASGITVTLPATATIPKGKKFRIKKIAGAGVLTVTSPTASSIEGSTSVTVTNYAELLFEMYAGTPYWYILNQR
jgi:hypothetical protein